VRRVANCYNPFTFTFTLLRRDRLRRKGGGVALYVRASLSVLLSTFSADNRTYELLWAKFDKLFVGVLYHPPKPCYTVESLLDYLESAVDEILRDCPDADIVLAVEGDFNRLPEDLVVLRTGLTPYSPSAYTWRQCSRPDIRILSDLHYTMCCHLCANKKLSYRRGTARCVVSVEILPIATQPCRNYLYDKSSTNRSYEVGGLQWADV